MSKNNTPTRPAQKMFRVIEQFLSINLSRQEFCQQHGIRYSTLHWWLSQYRRHNGQSQQRYPYGYSCNTWWSDIQEILIL